MTRPRVERIAYRDGYRYQLADHYAIQTDLRPTQPILTEWVTLDVDGVLVIRSGYAWDGASGPTLDGPSSIRPSLVHDVIYQLIGLGHLEASHAKPYADDLFARLLAEDGMPWWRRACWHRAVQWFGPRGGSRPKEIKRAP